MIEQKIRELFKDPVQGWTDALNLLAAEFGARGGEVGMINKDGRPQILASCGSIEKITTNQSVWDFYCGCWGQKELVGECKTVVFEAPEPVACAAFNHSETDTLGIVLWGSFKSQFKDLSLACTFLRLLEYSIYNEKITDVDMSDVESGAKVFPSGYVVGRSLATTLLYRELQSLSQGDFPVTITGETGVGKEHIAQLLHLWSNRAGGAFIPVNCVAIPSELWEAEMFGVGKGVATGVYERDGYFQRANGGTLFLDEVSELPLPVQTKLLRVLQDQIVPRVGGAQIPVNIRVIAASNTDLSKRIEDGSFRVDLYYRIASVLLRVPPLRERREDILLLLQHFLRSFSRDAKKFIPGFSLQAFELLNEYAWPGNVRELEHEIRRLVYVCPEGQMISSKMLSERIILSNKGHFNIEGGDENCLNLNYHIKKLEQELIIRALTKALGNRTQAAKLLGITRPGLALKMERLGIK
jgi:DNA-binding NtrC family response regulator